MTLIVDLILINTKVQTMKSSPLLVLRSCLSRLFLYLSESAWGVFYFITDMLRLLIFAAMAKIRRKAIQLP
jgi:hypothetical protein